MSYGLLPTGFVAPTLEAIRAELEDALRGTLGADVDTSPGSVLGSFVDVVARRERDLWSVTSDIYDARDPSKAEGAALTELAELTGTVRRGPARGRVVLTLRLARGAVVRAGSLVAVDVDSSNTWRTVAEAANYGASETSVEVVAESVTAGRFEAQAGQTPSNQRRSLAVQLAQRLGVLR